MNQSKQRNMGIPCLRVMILTVLAGGFAMQAVAGDRDAIKLSTTSFNFRRDFVGSPFIRTVTTVTNTGRKTVSLNPSFSGDDSFTLAAGSCGATLAEGMSCIMNVQFLPLESGKAGHHATLTLNVSGSASKGEAGQQVELQGEAVRLQPGEVAQTANSMVALYTVTLPQKASWVVNFGTTESYGQSTSIQIADEGPSSVYVAGMLPNTLYHMQATVTLEDGATAVEPDLMFTTGALPPGIPATVPVTLTPGMTPQPGVELVNPISGAIPTTAFVTDLQGNVIWAYQFPDRQAPAIMYPVRLLPNGHFLSMIAPGYPFPGNLATDLNMIREFDLTGNTVQQLTMADLNARLAANGFNVTLMEFSHDIVLLPNGHYLVIANTVRPFTNLPGHTGVTQVNGDTVVDLDKSLQPRWIWNSFDHLDVNRHPMGFPDWTHANSVAYSKDDGNFIISLRHQNWVLKIDYENGAGNGNIIWHLGEGGDFKLTNGTDPTDWFYAQHYANFISPNTTGVFNLELFDNGDDRMFPEGLICGPLPGQTPCLYSTVPQFQIDETAMTATFLFHDMLPHSLYSFFAGNNDLLANGDFQFNLAGAAGGADAIEVRPGASLNDPAQTVWKMTLPGTQTYRMNRLPSLYPGVQW